MRAQRRQPPRKPRSPRSLPPHWTGTAADAFANYRVIVRGQTTTVQNDLVRASAAVSNHAETLHWAQRPAATAITLWDATDVPSGGGARGPNGVASSVMASATANALAMQTAQREQAQTIPQSARTQLATSGDRAAAVVNSLTTTIPRRSTTTTPLTARTKSGATPAGLFDDVITLLAMGTDPVAANAWWKTLSDTEKKRLIETFPSLIGNLEGITYADRDTANRLYLDAQIQKANDDIARLEKLSDEAVDPRFKGAYSSHIAVIRSQMAPLESIKKALGTSNADGAAPARQLISLSHDIPPLAALSVGDMDAATNITYVIPGINTTTRSGGLGELAQAADNLRLEQQRATDGEKLAVVAWIGYKTPQNLGVLSVNEAEVGGAALDRSLLGVSATNSSARLSVAALSYGGTTAAEALARGSSHVDTVTLIAVPGVASDLDRASDLNADEVFAGENDGTWALGRSPSHPSTPTDSDFGAKKLGTDGGGGLLPVTEHSALGSVDSEGNQQYGYFSPGTKSLRNIALATTGHGDEVDPS